MAAFFRGFLLFAVGAAVGAAAVFLFAPGFSVAVSRAPGNEPRLTLVNPLARPAVVVPEVLVPVPQDKPTPVVTALVPVSPVAIVEPTTKPAASSLDFKSISEHTIFWPNSVSVTAATKAALLDDGKKSGETELPAGTVIQISKVLSTGAIEGRARGSKLEVNSLATNFEDALRKRLAELTEKGAKFTPPFLADAAASPAVATAETPAVPAPAAVAATPVSGPAVSSAPATLEDKVNVLFGRKPEAKTEKPATPTAPAPATTPAPAAAMQAEKKEDLDRKINQLFKKDAAK
jgi:hypothetical protein